MLENILKNQIWQNSFFNNTLIEYLIFFLVFLFLSLSFFAIKYVVLKKISKKLKKQKFLELIIIIVEKIKSPFYCFVSFYIALSVLEITELISKILFYILIFLISYRMIIAGYQAIDFILDSFIEKKANQTSKSMIRALGNIAKGALWILAGVVILSLLGVDVTGLVAGMGIGGIAIAFALQGILSDLFSSFSLYFDKPFIEGDFIVVGDTWGTVEKIGIKSTRIRALQGEEIIFSNKELTTARVHNMKKMERRRAQFTLGVTYETPLKKMEKIPGIIRKIIEKEEIADLDRINFINFSAFSLDYGLVYFINSPDYKVFIETNERILLSIKKNFEQEKIEFAYPTRKIYLAK